MSKFSRMMAGTAALTAALLLVGCNPTASPKADQTPANEGRDNLEARTQQTPAERKPNLEQVSEIKAPRHDVRAPALGATDNQGTDKSLNQQADEIAEIVNRIPGVERSAVLLTGKTALVGVDLQNKISGSKIDSIKFSVKEAAERTGKGYNAVVTADIDTVTRVRELIAGVRAGKPVSTVSDEIADIVSRLLPEM